MFQNPGRVDSVVFELVDEKVGFVVNKPLPFVSYVD
jgi:hypothetical protein